MTDRKLKIIYEDPAKLKPYKHNAKVHTPEQIEQIKRSIREFSFNDPIAVDETYTVIEGHGRLKAAQELGMQEVPIIILDGLTDQQKKAYILAHNQLTLSTGFDIEILADELERITQFDMREFGFLDDAFGENETDPDTITEDEPPAPPVTPKAKPGDIYQLGRHRLMCGDSTKPEDVERLMSGEKADLVVTDPPYNVDYSQKANRVAELQNKHSTIQRKTDRPNIEHDTMSDEAFIEFLAKAFKNIKSNTAPGGAFYIWYASTISLLFWEAFKESGLKVHQNLTWIKNHFTLSFSDYHNICEPCFYGWIDGSGHYFTDCRSYTTLLRDDATEWEQYKKEELVEIIKGIFENTDAIREDKPVANDLHPTMKPVKLIARLIRNSSRTGELVLDLFGGSGTTLIAAEQMGRRCFMMEYEPRYIDVIIERWETLTGRKAEKIESR